MFIIVGNIILCRKVERILKYVPTYYVNYMRRYTRRKKNLSKNEIRKKKMKDKKDIAPFSILTTIPTLVHNYFVVFVLVQHILYFHGCRH